MVLTAEARAQTNGGVKLDWDAAPGCPTQKTFVDGVHARSPAVRIAPDSPRTLFVRIARQPNADARSAFGGKIELRESDGATTQRSVSGASCDEVVGALALVTALALDPMAGHEGATETHEDGGGAHAANTPTSTAAASSSTPPTTAKTATTTTSKREDGEEGKPVEKRAWSFEAGVDAEALVGITPDAILGMPVFFGVRRALSERIGLGGGIRFERAGQAASVADFTWTAGAVDGCVVIRAGRARFDGCARAHVGAIDAHGDVVPERSASRPWIDGGLALALRLRIAGPLFAEAQGYAGLVFVRDRFYIEPDTTVFQPPLVTGHVGGGLGFEIW